MSAAEIDPAVVALMQAEFDADYYRAANKDVADAGGDPFAHFLTYGWREGRDPNAAFSMRRYLDVNADVKIAGANAFAHYLAHGRAEGRPTDHGLGFRYEILMVEPQAEERIRNLRRAIPDRAADPVATLEQATAALEPRPVHVTVSHDDPFAGVGGVQLCIRLEAEAMRAAGRTSLHLFPSAAATTVDVERDAPTLGVILDGVLIGHYGHQDAATVLGPVVRDPRSTFAIHSLIGHAPARLIETLRDLGMQQGHYWIHDYGSLCAGYALMRNDVTFCGAPAMSSPACEICAYGRRRRVQLPAHVALFKAFELTAVAPSHMALDLWSRRFPAAPAGARVHPHAELAPRLTSSQPEPAGPLRIAFLGMPAVHKGWPVFSELAERFADDPRYEFHHLGARQAPGTPALFTEITPSSDDPQPMIAAIEGIGIDVVVLWSLWPETFCFAAYEAIAAGAMILTNPDSGNVRDFVAADPARGRVLADETALGALFHSEEALAFARGARPVALHDLRFSRMTADLILQAAP